ncbi:MAG TPA: hypothetical protein VE988_15600, partial [Gemmataceae bacterium]|nr:hypothetical protein [Gemmataceae bacterium]
MSVRLAAGCVVVLLACAGPSPGQGVGDGQTGVRVLPSSPANLGQPIEVLNPIVTAPPPTLPSIRQEQPNSQEKKDDGTKEKLAALEKSVTELSKNLTVFTADKDFKLLLGGAIVADFLYNSARPVAPGVPFFLTPGSSSGFNQATFDANARQTNLFAIFSGPKICDFETGGVVLANFYNDAVIIDRYGVLPLLAFGQLKNDDWRFAAGLQFDIFNPLNPNILPFSLLAASGNTGLFRGQARVERYLHPSDCSQVTLTVGVSDPVPTTVNDVFRINEDNGWPNVEGRAALALGPMMGEGLEAKRPFEVGVSGVVGQIRTTLPLEAQVVADVWGLGSDMRWKINDRFGVQGEVYVGQSLGTYGGCLLQNVNAVTRQGLHSAGGWGEVYFYICPETLHTHVGYGIDDPLDGDLAFGQPVRNDTYFANLIWDVTKHLRFAGEVTFRQTAYTVVPNNDGVG